MVSLGAPAQSCLCLFGFMLLSLRYPRVREARTRALSFPWGHWCIFFLAKYFGFCAQRATRSSYRASSISGGGVYFDLREAIFCVVKRSFSFFYRVFRCFRSLADFSLSFAAYLCYPGPIFAPCVSRILKSGFFPVLLRVMNSSLFLPGVRFCHGILYVSFRCRCFS